MIRRAYFPLALLSIYVFTASVQSQEKPRVYITNSESWVAAGGFSASDGTAAGGFVAGSVPQTVQLVQEFMKHCPSVTVTNDGKAAAYVVLFDRNTAKRAAMGVYGGLVKVDKIAVFRRNGDALYSGSTRTVSSAVKDSCVAIQKDSVR